MGLGSGVYWMRSPTDVDRFFLVSHDEVFPTVTLLCFSPLRVSTDLKPRELTDILRLLVAANWELTSRTEEASNPLTHPPRLLWLSLIHI